MKAILSVFFLLVILPGCQKKSTYTTDFRDKYCGSYTFTVINSTHFAYGHPTIADTLVYSGSVARLNGSDTRLLIRYAPGKNWVFCNGDSLWGANIEPSISAAGMLSYPEASSCGALQPFSGSFVNTGEVSFHMYTAGQGSWDEQHVNGKR